MSHAIIPIAIWFPEDTTPFVFEHDPDRFTDLRNLLSELVVYWIETGGQLSV
jgi:hypothetical protein